MWLIGYLLIPLVPVCLGICSQDDCKNGGLKVMGHRDKASEKQFNCLCTGAFVFGECCQYVTCANGKFSESVSKCVCDPHYYGVACDKPDCGANGFAKFVDYTGREPCECHQGWAGRFCEEQLERMFNSGGRANHLYFRSLLGLGSLLFSVCMCSCWFARRNLLRRQMLQILQTRPNMLGNSVVSSSNGRFSAGNNVILTYSFTTAAAPMPNTDVSAPSRLADRPPLYDQQLLSGQSATGRSPKSPVDVSQSDLPPPSYEEAVRNVP